MCGQNQERDELRAKFTKWMEVVICRARLNYLKKSEAGPISISLDEVQDTIAEPRVERGTFHAAHPDSFDFDEDSLACAFAQLSPTRRKVLTMLFVLEMTPEEVAVRLGCSIQNVYNQRSLALKRLRAALEGGDYHDK